METSELIKKVRKIEIKTRGLSDQIFSGQYHTAFKGKGMAFSEVREYQYGDDIRSIDWNVTARFNHPYIKIFDEERELTVMLLIDISGSNEFGTQKQLKRELITEVAAVLSFSAIRNNDKVGVIFFSTKVEKFIPPKKGTFHILRIIRELINIKPENNGTDITEALKFFTNAIKKRSISFIISDFIGKDFEEALKIANRKHDVIALKINDLREKEIPDVGLMRVKDAETGKTHWIDTSSKVLREMYKKYKMDESEKLKNIFIKSGVDSVELDTGEDFIKPLKKLFKKREAR
ncbi:MAG TPA: DUF58 domain-containing protein [Bacteroidales bacterium]|nr:DUF58 domain-containing protein [Bacteroidales bacterium]HPS16356.1 DUF58 domain-containing protein [Bacteroidales bacterium]